MKMLANFLLLASSVLGLIAAGYWLKASKPVGDPFYGRGEGGNVTFNQSLETGANTISINQSAALNASAARWTAASVAVAAIGNIANICN